MRPVTRLHVPVATVVRTHGVCGELSIRPLADDPDRIDPGVEVWFVPPPLGPRHGPIESVRPGPKGPLLKVSGIDDADAASALRGTTVLVDPADLPEDWILPAAGLIGTDVYDETEEWLGTIVDVIETGANDVWVLEDDDRELLVPVIEDVLIEYDPGRERAVVRLPAGLGE